MQVLPQRPAAPPQWPPFEVAPTPPRTFIPRYPNLQMDISSASSIPGPAGNGSRFDRSDVVLACSLTIAAALLGVATYMCWRSLGADEKPGDAAHVCAGLSAMHNDDSKRRFPGFHGKMMASIARDKQQPQVQRLTTCITTNYKRMPPSYSCCSQLSPMKLVVLSLARCHSPTELVGSLYP